jgi:hypothetical protein
VVAKIKKVVKQLNKASKLHKRQSDIVKQHIKKMTGNKKKVNKKIIDTINGKKKRPKSRNR